MLLFCYFSAFILQLSVIFGKTSISNSDKMSAAFLENLSRNSKDGIIEFNAELLHKLSLIEHTKRDFNLFILFNALDKETNCNFCGLADIALRKISDVFNKKAKKGPLKSFFSTIELRPNIEAFKLMGLEHVPVVMHFGPDSRLPARYENNSPNDYVALLNFFASQSKSQVDAEEALKPEPSRVGLLIGCTVAVIVLGLILSGQVSASTIFKNEYLWSIAIMFFIMVMMSGYMWAKIRGPPFVGSTQSGDIMYFSTSPQSQLGIESRIITAVNAAIVFLFLVMVPITYRMEDNNKRRVSAMVLSLLYMFCHSGLLKIFAQKFPGYPLSYIF